MSKIVVIGSNHGGTAAVNTILDNYPEDEVVIFEKNTNISFLGCGMALWIGNQISGAEGLFYADKESLEKAGATVNMESEVTKVDSDNKIVHVTLGDGSKVEESYDKLIISTGSLPIIPNIPGKELENVQQVKLYQDAQEVIKRLADDEIKDVTVVGAGYIGVELAEAFQRNGKNVTLVDIEDTCLAGYYDREFSDLMSKNLEDKGIKLAYGETVKEIVGDKKVKSVITDKNEYKTDMVVLSVGFRPNVSLLDGKVEQFGNGAYIVDKNQMTSIKDIYAMGDCATVYDNATEDINYIALATNAVRGGIVAAHNACGTSLESIGVQGSNGINIYDLKMVSTGLSYEKAKALGYNAAHTDYKDKQKAGFMELDNPEVKIRIVYDIDSRRILGAQMASEYDMSMGIHMFSLAIQEKISIEKLSLLDIFFLPHFNQPYNYITMAALGAKE